MSNVSLALAAENLDFVVMYTITTRKISIKGLELEK